MMNASSGNDTKTVSLFKNPAILTFINAFERSEQFNILNTRNLFNQAGFWIEDDKTVEQFAEECGMAVAELEAAIEVELDGLIACVRYAAEPGYEVEE